MYKKLLSNLLLRGEGTLVIISSVLLLIMMLIMTADVIMRYVFGHPIKGVFELIPLLLVSVTFLSLAYTHKEKGHLRITIITDRIPAKARTVLNLINLALSVGVVVLLMWGSIPAAIESITTGEVPSMGSSVPVAPARVAICIGCLAFFIRLVYSITRKDEWHEP